MTEHHSAAVASFGWWLRYFLVNTFLIDPRFLNDAAPGSRLDEGLELPKELQLFQPQTVTIVDEELRATGSRAATMNGTYSVAQTEFADWQVSVVSRHVLLDGVVMLERLSPHSFNPWFNEPPRAP